MTEGQKKQLLKVIKDPAAIYVAEYTTDRVKEANPGAWKTIVFDLVEKARDQYFKEELFKEFLKTFNKYLKENPDALKGGLTAINNLTLQSNKDPDALITVELTKESQWTYRLKIERKKYNRLAVLDAWQTSAWLEVYYFRESTQPKTTINDIVNFINGEEAGKIQHEKTQKAFDALIYYLDNIDAINNMREELIKNKREREEANKKEFAGFYNFIKPVEEISKKAAVLETGIKSF